MKLENTTNVPNYYLRRMISWICKQLEVPVRQVRYAKFGNRSHLSYSGHAWSTYILCNTDPRLDKFPAGRKRSGEGPMDRKHALVCIAAHEICHLATLYREARGQKKTRRGGKSRGGSEAVVRREETRIAELFERNRNTLTELWSTPPKKLQADRRKSAVQQREERAAANLARWERKLKLAKTKVAKYRKTVRYYDRRHVAARKADVESGAPA